jgi:hypothetical protein
VVPEEIHGSYFTGDGQVLRLCGGVRQPRNHSGFVSRGNYKNSIEAPFSQLADRTNVGALLPDRYRNGFTKRGDVESEPPFLETVPLVVSSEARKINVALH